MIDKSKKKFIRFYRYLFQNLFVFYAAIELPVEYYVISNKARHLTEIKAFLMRRLPKGIEFLGKQFLVLGFQNYSLILFSTTVLSILFFPSAFKIKCIYFIYILFYIF